MTLNEARDELMALFPGCSMNTSADCWFFADTGNKTTEFRVQVMEQGCHRSLLHITGPDLPRLVQQAADSRDGASEADAVAEAVKEADDE